MGFPVAIHAVERDAVVASALAIGDARPLVAEDGSRVRDRIEHCAECPPDVLELVAQSGAMVVPNPGFLHYDGERYQRTVAGELMPYLYPVGALVERGIPTCLGLRRAGRRAEPVGVNSGRVDSSIGRRR